MNETTRDRQTGSGLYRLCGLSIRSQLPLPEVPPLALAATADKVDLEIRFGAVPETLAEADHAYPLYETRGTDRLLVKAPGVARYLLQGPGMLTVDPENPVADRDIRAVLLGSAMGGVFHMRGLLPLHASAVRIGDGVVAFTGASGAGKSTLAAFLAERGHRLITDDICVIEPPGAATVARIRPSFARLRLWGDSMDALGKPRDAASRALTSRPKYQIQLQPEQEVLPLRGVVALTDGDGDLPHLAPLRGGDAIACLLRNVFRPEYAQSLGRGPAGFAQAGAILRATPVYQLARRRDFARMGMVIAQLEAAFGA